VSWSPKFWKDGIGIRNFGKVVVGVGHFTSDYATVIGGHDNLINLII